MKRVLKEYEEITPDMIKILNFTTEDVLKHLDELHSTDALRTSFISTESYGNIPVYGLFFFLLQEKCDTSKTSFEEYGRGYTEGLKSNFVPFIDTPENRRELVIDVLTWATGFPMAYRINDDGERIGYSICEENLYEYGFEIGKQKKAWDIVLESQLYFKEFLDSRRIKKHIVAEAKQEVGKNNELSFAEKHLSFFLDIHPRAKRRVFKRYDEEYKRMIEYTDYFFDNNFALPPNIIPIKCIRKGETKGDIYRVYKTMFREKNPSGAIPDSLIEFLQKVFAAMQNDKEKTIKTSISNNR